MKTEMKTWVVKAGDDSEEVKAIDAGSAVTKVMRKYHVPNSQRNQFSAKLKGE